MNDRDRLIELIADIQNDFEKWCVECAEDGHKDHQPLGEYLADKLLQNGAIVPPCKVGDKLYSVFNGDVKELKVISYSLLNSTIGIYQNIHTVNSRGAVVSYELHDFGKTVFLTKEEAEKALAERSKK